MKIPVKHLDPIKDITLIRNEYYGHLESGYFVCFIGKTIEQHGDRLYLVTWN